MLASSRIPGKFLAGAELRDASSRHMPALDGLRGIAILMVLVAHLDWGPQAVAGLPARIFLILTTCGWTGVELFFVLSGFLITGILLDSKSAENYFSSFYVRRALRILPLSYAVIFIVCDLGPWLGKLGVPFMPTQFSSAQIWYWLYAGNYAPIHGQGVPSLIHFWSLAVEEQFYLLWPFAVFAFSRRNLGRICVTLILLIPVLRILQFARNPDPFGIYMMTTSHLDALGSGGLVALIVRDDKWSAWVVPRLHHFIYAGLAGFFLTGIANRNFTNDSGPTFVFGCLPLSLAFAAIVLRAVATTGVKTRFQKYLQAGWLRAYGKYSYAIYVLHFPIVVFVSEIAVPRLVDRFHGSALRAWAHHAGYIGAPLFFVLGVIVVLGAFGGFLGLGKLSWRAFEGPINGLKKNFAPRYVADPQKLVAIEPTGLSAGGGTSRLPR